ncbi:MAG: hypothetical protein IKO40_03665 [Kiritimatiellae bacterium]|nr:hypothetical protein [Kiritimatiellia bacterium]
MTMTRQDQKRLAALIAVALLLGAVAYRLFHPKDPLADLKRMESVEFSSEARQTVEQALQHIADGKMDKLFAMLLVRDSQLFQVNFLQDVLDKELGAFTPATVVGSPRRLVVSSRENLLVRLHSEPRNEDYYLSLVHDQGAYRIAELVPTSRCGGI